MSETRALSMDFPSESALALPPTELASPEERNAVPVHESGAADDARAPSRLPFTIFCLYTFILIGRPQDYVPSLAPLRLALVFTGLTALMTLIAGARGRSGSPLRLPETRLYLALFLVMCAGIPFSLYRKPSFEFVLFQYSANVVFFFLFLAHVNTIERLYRVVNVLMLSALVFSAVGLTNGYFIQGRYTTGSEMFDANDVAFVEVSLLGFGLAVLLSASRVLVRLVALASVALGVLLALYTGSRGGLLGLLTLFALLFFLRLPGMPRSRKGFLLVALGIVLAANFEKVNVDRYLTLTDLKDDYNVGDEFGRTQIWQRGVQLFLEHPLTGVGVTRFGEAIGTMRKEERLLPRWQSSHNSYVQILTETGFFGALTLLLLIVTCLRTFNRLRRAGQQQLAGMAALPGMLLVGFSGLVVAAFFLSQGYSMSFTLFFAVSAALNAMASPPQPETDGQ